MPKWYFFTEEQRQCVNCGSPRPARFATNAVFHILGQRMRDKHAACNAATCRSIQSKPPIYWRPKGNASREAENRKCSPRETRVVTEMLFRSYQDQPLVASVRRPIMLCVAITILRQGLVASRFLHSIWSASPLLITTQAKLTPESVCRVGYNFGLVEKFLLVLLFISALQADLVRLCLHKDRN